MHAECLLLLLPAPEGKDENRTGKDKHFTSANIFIECLLCGSQYSGSYSHDTHTHRVPVFTQPLVGRAGGDLELSSPEMCRRAGM